MSLLLTSISELRQYVSFSGDLEYETLQPAIRNAQQFLVRYVGLQLLEELSAESLSDDQQALLPYVLAPIANLTLLKYVQGSNVRITDLGLMRTKTADSNDAFEWQVERTVQYLRQEVFDSIESLLTYLSGKLTTFPAYATADAYKAVKDQLISSAVLFSQFYDIGGSRLIFQTLQASMRTAELPVKKMLGDRLPDLLTPGDDADKADQLDAARRALVYLTIARALREKLVSISDTGVQVCAISNFGTLNYKQPASDKQLQTSILYFDEQAAGFVADLATLLAPPPSGDSNVNTSPILGTKIVAI